MVLREDLAPYVADSGVDPSGLGHWSWYQVEGSEGIKTRILPAYTPNGQLGQQRGNLLEGSETHHKEGSQNKPQGDVPQGLALTASSVAQQRGTDSAHDGRQRGRDRQGHAQTIEEGRCRDEGSGPHSNDGQWTQYVQRVGGN